MKAYEIPIKIPREGNIEFPEDLLSVLPRGQVVKKNEK